MPLTLSALRTFVVVLGLAVLAPGGASAFAAQGPSIATLRATGAAEIQDVFIRAPQNAPDGALQVLVALHGMGGNGADFGASLASQADANGWLIVAPTINYGDWTDPAQIAREEPALVAWLSEYVANLPAHTGLRVRPGVLVFGHSRGAQLALRFTEIHPAEVTAVAAVSAGTYTLPFSRDVNTGKALQFPFGVANLSATDGGQAFDSHQFESVPIWIGVGAADTVHADVPNAWDPYIGPDRVDRARTFTQALITLGATVSLTEFANTGHTLTDEMRVAGCAALASAT